MAFNGDGVQGEHGDEEAVAMSCGGHDSSTERRILLIGGSAQLLALQAWAIGQGFRMASTPNDGVMFTIVDEDVQHGICTPAQAAMLAEIKKTEVECLLPQAGWDRLRAMRKTTEEKDESTASDVDKLADLIEFPGTE